MTLPVVVTQSGYQPRSAQSILNELITIVQTENPGYTVLPGGLIEDISSTDVAAISLCDSFATELINSITPFGANEFLLNQLGQVYGVPYGQPTNTNVIIFFTGTPGFVVKKGFIVSDGTHQYTVQESAILGSLGTASIFCVATTTGTWAVSANTVNQIITSVPLIIGLSVNNPSAGNPETMLETWDNYRARVLEAGLAIAQGMPTFLRKLLNNVPGVTSRLISIRLLSGNWQIICGGGDPYLIAFAIFIALFDISDLTGSVHAGRNITVTINDYPDSYNVIFVNPQLQVIGINLLWDTTATNFVSDTSVTQLGSAALLNYINSLYVGQAINIFEMQTVFIEAIASVIPGQSISKINFQVYINSILTPPVSGTGLVEGDPEGYFQTEQNSISISRS